MTRKGFNKGSFRFAKNTTPIMKKGVIRMLLFDNCSFYHNPDAKSDRPYIIGVRDRECSDTNMERWNMASLTEEDAKKIYNLLKNHFKEES